MNRPGLSVRSPKELSELAKETRVLADEIAQGLRSNPERLNMPTIMTAILRGLRNQEAILDALANLSTTPTPVAAPAPSTPTSGNGDKSGTDSGRSNRGRGDPSGDRNGADSGRSNRSSSGRNRRIETPDEFDGDALEIDLSPAPSPKAPDPVEGARAKPSEAPPERPSSGRETESVTGPRARAIVGEFDNRDKSFERGLSKLNAWLSSGGLGLPFQKRDSHAYLNTGALSEAMLAHVERELTGREGYSVKLGRLVVDGLQGEVVIYAKLPAGGSPLQ